MALSSEEHALLVQTCDSMNLSAEVNREVLELVRNLGNTGVVDIATHDNASDAHANVKSIVHLNTSLNSVSIGDPGHCNDKGSHSADTHQFFRLLGSAGFYPSSSDKRSGDDLILIKNTYGNTYYPTIFAYLLEANSSGEVAADKNNSVVFSLSADYQYLDDGTVKTKNSRFWARNSPTATFPGDTGTCWLLALNNGSSSGNALAFGSSAIIPLSGFTGMTIGNSTVPFGGAYFATEPVISSDRRAKSGISAIGSEAVDFIKALRPVQFSLKSGTEKPLETDENGDVTKVETISGVRTHWGLIAQEVREAMDSAGIEDAAVWCLEDKNDPDSRQSLRYGELIAPMIKVIQQQQERIEALERRLA